MKNRPTSNPDLHLLAINTGLMLGAAHIAPSGDDNAPLAFPTRHGLMKGYIDLVFEHDGRFHLADYKSNHLGNTAEDYRAEHLTQAMRTHRYDLQAMIYAVALHRYLRRRIPDYRFDTHFGGVHYLFLRGMSAKHPAGTGVYSFKPDPQRIERLDRLFAAGVA